jgi:hypothetical protein
MAKGMGMLGVRIPEGSDIPDRLRARSLETRRSYYELIDQWLSRDEREKAEGLSSAESDTGIASQEQTSPWESLLETRLAEMQTAIAGDVKAMVSSMLDERISQALAERETEAKEPKAQRPIDRIKELHAEGVPLRKIADTLKAEGYPTMTEGGSWSHTAVKRMLDKG